MHSETQLVMEDLEQQLELWTQEVPMFVWVLAVTRERIQQLVEVRVGVKLVEQMESAVAAGLESRPLRARHQHPPLQCQG